MNKRQSKSRRRNKQDGYVLVIALIALLAATTIVSGKVAATLFRKGAISDAEIVRAQKLAQEAKWALIGYAASETKKPGTLPCPDSNGGGVSQSIAGKCHSGTLATDRITGCLPWRTLGLEGGTDESGARLLYSLSSSWRNLIATNKRTPNDESNDARPINPGNFGSIELHVDTQASTKIVAAIIVPGLSLAMQDRTTVSEAALCAGSFASHLETSTDFLGANIDNTIDGNAQLISAKRSNTFNDRLTTITREEIFRPLLLPVLRLFYDGTTARNYGLPYYFANSASSPVSLMINVSPTGPQKAAAGIDRIANYNLFDLALIPEHSDQASANKGGATIALTDAAHNYCASDNANTPADWLCFNNWYHYLEFSGKTTPNEYSLSIRVDTTKPSRTCTLSSEAPYTSETLSCTN